MKVVLDKVTKKYDLDTLGVEDVDMTAEDCVYGIVGEAGSGKSTVLRLIGGIVDIDGGKLTFDGKVMNRVPPKERNVVLVSGSPLRGSVRRVLSYGLKLRRYPRAEIKQRTEKAAELFGFSDRMNVNVKSLGAEDVLRLGLARAAARKAKVVLIDEPYVGVRETTRAALYSDIKKLAEYAGGVVFVASSDGADAEYTGDVISVLRNGRVIRTGTFTELTEDPRTAYIARFVGEMPVNILHAEDGVFAVRADKIRITDGDYTVTGVSEKDGKSVLALCVDENAPPFIVISDRLGLKVGDKAGYEILEKTLLSGENEDRL